jgi:hypothetical protein
MWKRMKDQKLQIEPQKLTNEHATPPAAAPTHHQVALTSRVGIKVSATVTPKIEISVTQYAPENWDRLFAIGDDGQSVWLKFLPDTKHYRADTLVLVVYGQKVLRDVHRIKVEAAHSAVEKTVSNAPNQPRTSNTLWAAMIGMQQLGASVNRDWVDECVPLHLERVGLSQGGFYQLTQDGERHAANLAYDLIRRA